MEIEQAINKVLADNLKAMNALLESRCYLQLLTILYASVDQFSWLVCGKSEQDGADFKKWCDDYLRKYGNVDLTADELWAARCAVLHTLTSVSRDTRKGVNEVYYTIGQVSVTEKRKSNTVFASLDALLTSYGAAGMWFVASLKNRADVNLNDVESKLKMILSKCEISGS